MREKANLIKEQILKQYKSVRQFAIAIQLPYSTVAAALDKGDCGIEAMAYGTVVEICKKLNISSVDFLPMQKAGLTEQERRLLIYFCGLNKAGQEKVLEYAGDITEVDKYMRGAEDQ